MECITTNSRMVRDHRLSFLDNYSTAIVRQKNLKYFFKFNPDIALMLYYRNDPYGLFENAFTAAALKTFLSLEHIYTYILIGLDEMTLSESVERRYTNQGFTTN